MLLGALEREFAPPLFLNAVCNDGQAGLCFAVTRPPPIEGAALEEGSGSSRQCTTAQAC